MGDLIKAGVSWLQGQLKQHCSTQVTYRRGNASVVVHAVTGRTLLRLADEYGATRVEWTDRDYLIARGDLVLAGAEVTPARGDRIEESQGGVTYLYEVAAPGGEPPWRWSDNHLSVRRIHAKRVGVSP